MGTWVDKTIVDGWLYHPSVSYDSTMWNNNLSSIAQYLESVENILFLTFSPGSYNLSFALFVVYSSENNSEEIRKPIQWGHYEKVHYACVLHAGIPKGGRGNRSNKIPCTWHLRQLKARAGFLVSTSLTLPSAPPRAGGIIRPLSQRPIKKMCLWRRGTARESAGNS